MAPNSNRLISITNRMAGKKHKLEDCGEEFSIEKYDISKIIKTDFYITLGLYLL